ncbi:hypothetical protein BGZ83_010080 [Gryganskiella cystojenkinii]|nr:hypothetical protein BGZ83_010080 [Gryganskiella cystojenkinii]
MRYQIVALAFAIFTVSVQGATCNWYGSAPFCGYECEYKGRGPCGGDEPLLMGVERSSKSAEKTQKEISRDGYTTGNSFGGDCSSGCKVLCCQKKFPDTRFSVQEPVREPAWEQDNEECH